MMDYIEITSDPDKPVAPRGVAHAMASLYQFWAFSCVLIVGGQAFSFLIGISGGIR